METSIWIAAYLRISGQAGIPLAGLFLIYEKS